MRRMHRWNKSPQVFGSCQSISSRSNLILLRTKHVLVHLLTRRDFHQEMSQHVCHHNSFSSASFTWCLSWWRCTKCFGCTSIGCASSQTPVLKVHQGGGGRGGQRRWGWQRIYADSSTHGGLPVSSWQHTKCLPEVLQMEESKTPYKTFWKAPLIFHQNCVYARKQTKKEVCRRNPPWSLSLTQTQTCSLVRFNFSLYYFTHKSRLGFISPLFVPLPSKANRLNHV